MLFPCLTVFMIILSVFAFLRKRSSRSEEAREEAFWERESQANNTRKADLDKVDYITVNPADFPLDVCTSSEAEDFKKQLLSFQEKRLLNLNGLSNTELKLTYGPQNLESLTQYDQNFSDFEKWILAYGSFLNENGHSSEAIHVLEKGIALHTDLSGNYLLLGELYQKANRSHSIDSLIQMCENLNDITRTSTIRKLEELKNLS